MTKIQLRRDTAANWSTNNPTPSAGEPCFETDTGKLKIGDGVTKYTNLPYQGGGSLEVCDIGMALYVDETKGLRRYLNGQIVDINTNTQKFLNRLKQITTLYPSLLCTEKEWQSAKTISAFGQVGKFVFNYNGDEVVSVRLPRVVNVQGLFDLQNLGMTVSESLPNIKGTAYGSRRIDDQYNTEGALYWKELKTDNSRGAITSGNAYSEMSIDASKSSSTYQDNAHVQQEAIQYPYFIQIATGSETENNIINDIELNNPYSLFDSKYSDHELNNLSWLKSDGQWNAKAIYPTAYDKLLKVYNGTETVEGLSVKLSTEEYTDYDFVLNTADETFRLPLLDGSEDLLSDRHDDLKLLVSGSKYIAPANGWFWLSKRASAANQYINIGNDISGYVKNYSSGSDDSMNLIRQARKGEAIFSYYNANGSTNNFRFIYAQGNGSLYFYVGETVQNANLIDAGRIGEQLTGKLDLDAQNLSADGKSLISGLAMPSNKYIDLELGASGTAYTAPADGYFYSGIVTNVQHAWMTMDAKISVVSYGTETGNFVRTWLPVKKGEEVIVKYGGGQNGKLKFVYAVGSEPQS